MPPISTPGDLISRNKLEPEMLAYLWFSLELGCSTLISGIPRTEKKSYLEALSFFLPSGARVACISEKGWRFHATEEWNDIRGASRSFSKLLGSVALDKTDRIILESIDTNALKAMLKVEPMRPLLSTIKYNDIGKFVSHSNVATKWLTKLDVVAFVKKTPSGNPKERITEIVEIIGWNPSTPNRMAIYVPYWWEPNHGEYFFQGHSFLYERYCETKNITGDEMDRLILERADLLRWLPTKKMEPEEVRDTILSYYRDRGFIDRCRDDLRASGLLNCAHMKEKARIEWV